MDYESWKLAGPKLQQIAEKLDRCLETPEFQQIREMLNELSGSLGGEFVANLNCVVDIFDHTRGRSLPLLSTGVSSTKDGAAHRTWTGSTHERYLLNGKVQIVPHDHCPNCWSEWEFKFKTRVCPHCGAELGKTCKLLLDAGICPKCDEGEVSASNPCCNKCGFAIDPEFVIWGTLEAGTA